MDAIKPFPLMSGNVGDGYDIQLDARMARKSFIQAHACNVFGGKVFWVDGDVFTFADVPETFLDEVLPDDKLCCYLGREGSSFPSYTESGFLGFNASHEAIQNFMGAYLTIFKTGIIFTMEGWHDCYAFDAARHITQKHYRDAFVNLAAHLKPNETSHPFVNSVLGKYMDHRKGNRKLNGSRKSDIIVPRDEDYWRGTAAR